MSKSEPTMPPIDESEYQNQEQEQDNNLKYFLKTLKYFGAHYCPYSHEQSNIYNLINHVFAK